MGDTPREIRRQHAIRNQAGDGADGGRRRLAVWGMGLAMFTAVLSVAVFDYLLVPPVHTLNLDSRNAVVLGVFLVTGVLASRPRKAADAAARLSGEQAALRGLATLITQAAPEGKVFAAVAEEVGRLAYARTAQIFRYKPDGSIVRLAAGGQRHRGPHDLGAVSTGGHNVATIVLHSGKPARIDNTAAGPGRPSAVRPSSGSEIRVDAIACAPRGCEPGQVLSRATQDSAVGGALSEDVLSAAAEQLALLVGADVAAVLRHDADGATIVGAWSVPGIVVSVGSRDPLAERLASVGVRSRVESPILVDDRVWGVVVAATKAEAPPQAQERVRAFAGLVAVAVANARRLEELERVPAEQAALRRLGALVAGAAPPGDVFAAVAEEVGRVFGADVTGVSRYESDGTATTVAAWSVRGTGVPLGFQRALGGRNLNTIVHDTGQPARMDDYPEEASDQPPEVRVLDLHSAVAVPITVEGRLWGAMNVGSTGDAPLPPDTEARLVAFTELVATAIANSAARGELRSVAEEQAALRRIATLVAQAAPPAEVFTAVVEEIGRVFGADLTGLNRFEADETVTTVAAWSASGEAAPVGLRDRLGGNNLTSLVYATGRPARIERYAEDATNVDPKIYSFGIRSGVAVPVTVEGRLWGAVSVALTTEETPSPDTEARLVAFTELVATAIANSATREELRSVAEEQAALRRIATLVAQAAPPTQLFTAVVKEVGRVLGADLTGLNRFDTDETPTTTTVAAWSARGEGVPTGFRHPVGGNNLMSLVYFSGKPARIDSYAEEVTFTEEPTPLDPKFFTIGIRSGVAVPVTVGGRLWGAISVASRGDEPPPPDTEARLVAFTELVGTAIANAQAQAELTASRARIIATADETRRRIERNLHDGAQQRLVSLALQLRAAQLGVPADLPELTAELDRMADGLNTALEELREYARGIHPAVLTESGLKPALRALGRRSTVPVNVAVRPERRLPEQVEVCAYYIVSEALANAAKHSGASRVDVEVEAVDSILRVRVADDGVGGACFAPGSGLLGLRDRAEAIGGRVWLRSERGAGTTIVAELPLAGDR